MPRGDATGPMGMGSLSGRGAGYCAGYDAPGFANSVPGRRQGRGRGCTGGVGFGRGRRVNGFGAARGYIRPFVEQDELAQLKSRAEYFTEELENVKKRLDEIKTKEQ